MWPGVGSGGGERPAHDDQTRLQVGLEELLQGDEPQRNRGPNGTLTAPPGLLLRDLSNRYVRLYRVGVDLHPYKVRHTPGRGGYADGYTAPATHLAPLEPPAPLV